MVVPAGTVVGLNGLDDLVDVVVTGMEETVVVVSSVVTVVDVPDWERVHDTKHMVAMTSTSRSLSMRPKAIGRSHVAPGESGRLQLPWSLAL